MLGGGKSEIKNKISPPEQFAKIMKNFPSRFISLQYGNCKAQVETWRHEGIDIIYDENINPLKNMDEWLAQVNCCDAVVSVANTTIHGSGALQKPTLCLQSRNTDWRWIDGLDCSYWYETVDAVSQKKDGSWDSALRKVEHWIENLSKSGQIQLARKIEKQVLKFDDIH